VCVYYQFLVNKRFIYKWPIGRGKIVKSCVELSDQVRLSKANANLSVKTSFAYHVHVICIH